MLLTCYASYVLKIYCIQLLRLYGLSRLRLLSTVAITLKRDTVVLRILYTLLVSRVLQQ